MKQMSDNETEFRTNQISQWSVVKFRQQYQNKIFSSCDNFKKCFQKSLTSKNFVLESKHAIHK